MSTEDSQPIIPYAAIRYVAMGEITIYLVSDDELRLLERGGPSSTYLNLAIFFMSTGASFFASLLLSPPSSIRRFIVMVGLTISSTIAGLVLFVLWRRYSGDLTDTIKRIRARRPPSMGEKIVEGTR